jgi:hypothetical protein
MNGARSADVPIKVIPITSESKVHGTSSHSKEVCGAGEWVFVHGYKLYSTNKSRPPKAFRTAVGNALCPVVGEIGWIRADLCLYCVTSGGPTSRSWEGLQNSLRLRDWP